MHALVLAALGVTSPEKQPRSSYVVLGGRGSAHRLACTTREATSHQPRDGTLRRVCSILEDGDEPRIIEHRLRRDHRLLGVERRFRSAEALRQQSLDLATSQVEILRLLQSSDPDAGRALVELVDQLGAVESLVVPAELQIVRPAEPALREPAHAQRYRG